MAEVRIARDTRLNRDVAVKLLRVDLASDQAFQERFRKEAESAASLQHPNIVTVHDTGEDMDPVTGVPIPYIVMELVQGRTLREILRQSKVVPPTTALEYTARILDALGYSHSKGIVHRDIKPANVMLTDDGVIKVMDFGIARAVSDTSSTMSQTAAVIGTASYFSPEQARGEPVDARSDIYSTGCLLYELLTGRPPFIGDSPVSVAYQHVQQPPQPPSRLNPDISPSIDALVLRALEKDPDARYQTAAAMRGDIDRIIAGHQVNVEYQPTVAMTAPTRAYTPDAGATAVYTTPAPTRAMAEAPAETTGGRRAVEESPKAPRRFAGLWVFLIALGLVAAGISIYIIVNNRGAEPKVSTVSVPLVLEKTQNQAKWDLEQAGLQVTIAPIEGKDDKTVGTVINQDPTAGTQVPTGTMVTIQVNMGPEKITLPDDFTGKDCGEYQLELTRLGFANANVVDATAEQEKTTDTADTVISVEPPPGMDYAKDQEISIVCATGKSLVPNVVGKNLTLAKQEMLDAGFLEKNITTKYTAFTTQAEEGTVSAQSPKANTSKSRKSTKITLTVVAKPCDAGYTWDESTEQCVANPAPPSPTSSEDSNAPAGP
jgi:serine/threonine-protein kinase